jgi:hypothetical protein
VKGEEMITGSLAKRIEVEILAARNKLLREALERIVTAYNGNPTPIHYKVSEAINQSREVLKAPASPTSQATPEKGEI